MKNGNRILSKIVISSINNCWKKIVSNKERYFRKFVNIDVNNLGGTIDYHEQKDLSSSVNFVIERATCLYFRQRGLSTKKTCMLTEKHFRSWSKWHLINKLRRRRTNNVIWAKEAKMIPIVKRKNIKLLLMGRKAFKNE